MIWDLRAGEDRLLYQYWREVGGTIWLEVPIGRGGRTRRIDAIIDPTGESTVVRGRIPAGLAGPLQVVEVKQELDATAVGQAMAGVVAIGDEYGAGQAQPVIVVRQGAHMEPHLKGACVELGVTVVATTPVTVVQVVVDDPDLTAALDRFIDERGLTGRAEAIVFLARAGLDLASMDTVTTSTD